MATSGFLSGLSMFLFPLLAVLLPNWLGQRYGLLVRKKSTDIQDAPIGVSVGATLGLFAFMLAFTFQIVGGRFDKRKQLLLDEIADIRSTYLYAGLVPDPIKSQTRRLILEYVDVRVSLLDDVSKFDQVKLRSEQILDSLWQFSETLAVQDRSSEAYSLYMASVDRILSLFNERITVTFQYRLPVIILYVLIIVAFFSMMALGYQFGISGKGNFLVNLILAITFASVMWLIFAMDRPEAGIIRMNPKPLLYLQEQLHQMSK